MEGPSGTHAGCRASRGRRVQGGARRPLAPSLRDGLPRAPRSCPARAPAPTARDRPDAHRRLDVRADGLGAEDAVGALPAVPGRGAARPGVACRSCSAGRWRPPASLPLLRVRWSLHLLRGVLGVAMMAAFVYALQHVAAVDDLLDLLRRAAADHRVVGAVPRRERRAARRWVAIGVGLIGVLVVLRPTRRRRAQPRRPGGAAGRAGATRSRRSPCACSASTDSVQAMMVWLLAMMAVGAGALAYPDWVPVRSGRLAADRIRRRRRRRAWAVRDHRGFKRARLR